VATGAGATEMAGAVNFFHRDPTAGEAEFFETRAQNSGDLAYAGWVEGSAIDIDESFEKGGGVLLICFDAGDDALLKRGVRRFC
jgi:hypothetical protein